jgi:hypothetical protein
MRHYRPASAAERSAEASQVERRAAQHQRLMGARDAQPGSIPGQRTFQGQHREITWEHLRQAGAAAGQDGMEAEAGA